MARAHQTTDTAPVAHQATAVEPCLAGDDPRLSAWRDFLCAHRSLLQQLEAELKDEHGIDLATYDVLAHLRASDQPTCMHELASAVTYTNSGVTRLIDRMTKDGLVRREQAPHDRRVISPVLTKKGLALLEKARESHTRNVQRHFGELIANDELLTIAQFLRKLVDQDRR